MKHKLRKDDMVMVISGQYKPRAGRVTSGRVLAVDRKKGRVLVEGVNYQKHHEKVREAKEGRTGGIEEREGWIDISKVALLDPETSKPARVGTREENGARVRYTKGKNASGKTID